MRADAITDFSQFAKLRADARSDSPEALRKTAQQFEALLMQQMLKSMRAASLGEDVLGGEQTQFYQEMADQQLAQHLSAGKGLGIADVLVKQLSQSRARPAQALAEQGASAAPAATAAAAPTPTLSRGAGEGFPALALSGSAAAGTAARTVRSTEEDIDARSLSRAEQGRGGGRAADFVAAVLPHAERAAAEHGIPAKVLVAQAALETGWGRHGIRRADGSAALNLFGIKADKRWQGEAAEQMTREYADGRMRSERARFRAYDSLAQSFDDYVHFLKSNPRYREALQHGGDPQRFASGLQKAGYATDPQYAQKILRIAEGRTMKLALAQVTATRTYTV